MMMILIVVGQVISMEERDNGNTMNSCEGD